MVNKQIILLYLFNRYINKFIGFNFMINVRNLMGLRD